MNGSIRESITVTSVHKVTWSYNDEPRIDRKELLILMAIGEQKFEAVRGRKTEYDNDWWLEWGDELISFCFMVESESDVS